MTSRYPPSSSDTRYSWERSPERFGRRPGDSRVGDTHFDRLEPYHGRGGAIRDPPRGPKAQLGRAGFASRGRGFPGRNEPYDRDPRDDVFSRGRGRGQDWETRERYDPRERRRSPPSRTRSRSPFREPRDTDVNSRRRNSRDPLPLPADVFPTRGRGSYRGRGRGDWDPSRGRAYHNEDRSMNPQNVSRDRQWDQSRDDDAYIDREKEREDRHKSDLVPSRPESRNSYNSSRAIPLIDPTTTRESHGGASAINSDSGNSERRHRDMDTRASKMPSSKGTERAESLYQRTEIDRTPSRASSPLAAPAVPAFGSVIPQPLMNQENVPRPLASKDEEQQIHPSRRSLVETTNDNGSSFLNAPTAPKAQQKHILEDTARPQQAPISANVRAKDTTYEAPANKADRYAAQAMPAHRTVEQPSVRKALEEEGRNGNLLATSIIAPSPSESSFQNPPIKIPTGPRAGRGGPPSIRQPMQPSIRAPMANRGPSMMGRGRGQANTWSWHNPAIRQAQHRGPSIMNRAPTRKDMEADDDKAASPSMTHAQVAVDQWRQKNNIVQVAAEPTAVELSDRPEIDKDYHSNMQTTPVSPVDTEAQDASEAANEAVRDNDLDLGLDDADLQKLQTEHDREMRRLESRKPPEPNEDSILLQSLEDLDALALAMKESLDNPGDDMAFQVGQNQIGEAFKEEEDEARYAGPLKIEEQAVDLESPIPPGTPPLESLPFLQNPGSTPFSEFDDVKTPTEEDDLIKNLIHARIQDEEDSKLEADQQARNLYRQYFKPWRQEVDLTEAAIRDEHAQEATTPPDSAYEATSVPQSVRSRRVVSDYSYQAVLQASVETHAREEQVRREREGNEAQHYIPADTCNPDREAVVPAMLGPVDAQEASFVDYVDQVAPNDVLEALRFLPPKDDFTVKEKAEFIQQYVQMPKRFGEISERMRARDYRACVRHYYHSKRSTNFRNAEAKFYKTNKGKRMREQSERNAGIRPRGGLLAAIDGTQLDQEAQTAASLTESGRPRRAAAPTFGEPGEGENGPPPAPTPTRRPTLGKESMPNTQGLERPVARRGRTGTGQKPGRKPKAQQLLAAAPTSSQTPPPSKDVSLGNIHLASEPIAEAPRAEEQEAAKLLAKLPVSVQPYQVPASYTESWTSGQVPVKKPLVTHEPSTTPKQQEISVPPSQPPAPAPTSAPQPKPQHTSEQPTSYWSVPEKQDFLNYVNYFGTDWASISRAMKTKSTQMIKNYYQREIDPKKGDKALDLQRAAGDADGKRSRGEDMGPMPVPTPSQPKRRYDSSTNRETQKAFAPVNITSLSNDENPSGRPAKTRTSPQDLASLNPRLSASSQAEQQAAASSAQVLAQGPQSPASRGVIHMQQGQQQRGQNLQHLIPVRSDNPKAVPISQSTPTTVDRHRPQISEKPENTKEVQEQHQRQYQKYLDDTKRREEALQMQDVRRQQQIRDQAVQLQMRQQQGLNQPRFALANPGINASPRTKTRTPHVHIDDESRRVLDQRQEELRRPPQILHRHSQGGHSSTIQPLLGSQGPTSTTQSPATSHSVIQAPTRLEPARPSSVPVPIPAPLAPSSQQPPLPPPPSSQPKRTSNIMSLLNSEPEEPKVSKRSTEQRNVINVAEPLSTEKQYNPYGHPPTQHFVRSETPRSTGQSVESYNIGSQAPRSYGSVAEVDRFARDIGREASYGIVEALKHYRKASDGVPMSKPSPSLANLLSASERPIASPPTLHSRSPSYTRLTTQGQQQLQRDARQPVSEAPSSRLRTNPWGTIPAPPSQATQERHSLSHHPGSSYTLQQAHREPREEHQHRRSLEIAEPMRSHSARHAHLEQRRPLQGQELVPRHILDRDPHDHRSAPLYVSSGASQEAIQHAVAVEEDQRKRREESLKKEQHMAQLMLLKEARMREERELEKRRVGSYRNEGQR